MAWQKMATRLNALPRVLAGPILRKVTDSAVTVWLALKSAANVTLTVSGPTGPILTGALKTCAIGTNLHLVAVTANTLSAGVPAGTKLVEGVIYTYDLKFDFPGETPPITGMTLANAIGVAIAGAPTPPLSYGTLTTPSFCLPPSDVDSLRLMYGSCRHPSGVGGPDQLATLDDLIAQSAQVAAERPHQLIFGGDQIYADDVAMSALTFLTDASDALLGWQEVLPLSLDDGGPRVASKIFQTLRNTIGARAGLTSDAKFNHLFTLGEYLCMYLFVWSDVLWDFNSFPTSLDVANSLRALDPTSQWDKKQTRVAAVDRENEFVKTFRASLSKVRRALANIPSYMILDDHDVTDDFNMTGNIVNKLYNNPMGKRIVQNALTAYTLCQHWGNRPEDFFPLATPPPGAALLKLLDQGNASTYDSNSAQLQTLVGVHDAAALPGGARDTTGKNVLGVFHDAGSLLYDYTIEGVGHQVLVTDTRTWRSYPLGNDDSPDLLPPAQIQRQITKTPATGSRALLVVLTTNAPPVPVLRYATRHTTISDTKEWATSGDRSPDLFESWELPSGAFDRLHRAISDKLPLVNGTRQGCAVILSGDVHSGFASRLLLTGLRRFEDPVGQSQPVNAVFAQLVSSSLRNQSGDTLSQHKGGYLYPGRVLIGTGSLAEGYAGFNVTAGPTEVGYYRMKKGNQHKTRTLTISGSKTYVCVGRLVELLVEAKPDYGYRLDYLPANLEDAVPYPFPPLTPLAPGADPEQALTQFQTATGNYRTYLTGTRLQRQIVGVNNLGEVTFSWSTTAPKKVRNTLRWTDNSDPKSPVLRFTTYVVSAEPADDNYKYSDVAAKAAPVTP